MDSQERLFNILRRCSLEELFRRISNIKVRGKSLTFKDLCIIKWQPEVAYLKGPIGLDLCVKEYTYHDFEYFRVTPSIKPTKRVIKDIDALLDSSGWTGEDLTQLFDATTIQPQNSPPLTTRWRIN